MMSTSLGELRIAFGEDTPEAELEALAREYRSDITVHFSDGRQFDIEVLTPRRISQELEIISEVGEFYFAEPGMIVLTEITSANIFHAVERLAKSNFFDKLVPKNVV